MEPALRPLYLVEMTFDEGLWQEEPTSWCTTRFESSMMCYIGDLEPSCSQKCLEDRYHRLACGLRVVLLREQDAVLSNIGGKSGRILLPILVWVNGSFLGLCQGHPTSSLPLLPLYGMHVTTPSFISDSSTGSYYCLKETVCARACWLRRAQLISADQRHDSTWRK